MFLKCEWYNYDFEVVIFPKDVEKYITRVEVDNFIIINGNLEINFEYKRKTIQLRDLKIATITQVRDQAKDLGLLDKRKRVTGMHMAKLDALSGNDAEWWVDKKSEWVEPDIKEVNLSEKWEWETNKKKEYIVNIPPSAKKEDLLILKDFLSKQESWIYEIFIFLKDQKISTKLLIANTQDLQKWEQDTWYNS